MRAEDRRRAETIKAMLREYSRSSERLPGIEPPSALDTFVFQVTESIRRIRYVSAVADRPISPLRMDPRSDLFDPVRAAILRLTSGETEEAGWLIFLFTHFGRNLVSGYQLIRDIYGRLGNGGRWDWETTSRDLYEFRMWLSKNAAALKSDVATHRAFGNHRKYQSLDAWKTNGTGAAIESYVAWVKQGGSHKELFARAIKSRAGNGALAFRDLYEQMEAVRTFGRTARFDYLCMIGKCGLAPIEPDSVHFQGATGPVTGAKLLFHGSELARVPDSALEHSANALAESLGINKQAMEDSLCNWQKSPTMPERFRG